MDYKLEGTDQILKALDALSSKETAKILKAANRKALAQKIVKPVKAALPYSAKTKKGIKIVADKEYKDSFFAGATSDVFFLRFLEMGTKERIAADGRSRGQITPRPIIKSTIMRNVDGVIDFFNKDFGQTLVQLMQRKIKRITK